MTLRIVTATRYVTPLREGGSLPAIIEADDDGMYVLKFRGAGQGPKALIAELVAGELARALGLAVPELVFVELDGDLARTEPDPEIQSLIRDSAGLNLALDYLPGSITFDPIAERIGVDLASAIVWFDALVTNVDRTPRNANLLMWHKQLWLIDHGAALYFHHTWTNYLERSRDSFSNIKDHVLLPFSSEGSLREVDEKMIKLITAGTISDIVKIIPDEWLRVQSGVGNPPFTEAAEYKAAYTEYLEERLKAPRAFVEEAIRARKLSV